VVAENVLSKVSDEDLQIYVVWMPVLAADDREAALKSQSIIEDSRASHFWDLDQSLGRAYGRSIDIPRGGDLAWDMYLVFGRDAKWETALPVPSLWNHQLGMDARYLGDGSAIRTAIGEAGK
jgi:hypothetical protein